MQLQCICGLSACVCGLEVPECEDFDPFAAAPTRRSAVMSFADADSNSAEAVMANEGMPSIEVSTADEVSEVPKKRRMTVGTGTALLESTFLRQERLAPPDLEAQMNSVLYEESKRIEGEKSKSRGRCAPRYRPPSPSSMPVHEAELLAAYCGVELGADLLRACDRGELDAAKDLIQEYGVDVSHTNLRGTTPLIAAAAAGHTRLAALLLEHSAAIDEVDHNGRSAFWWACANGHAATAAMLLDVGADASTEAYEGGHGARLLALAPRQAGCLAPTSEAVLATGISPGAGAAAAAVVGGQDGVVTLLIERAARGACGRRHEEKAALELCAQLSGGLADYASALDHTEMAAAIRSHLRQRGVPIASASASAAAVGTPAARPPASEAEAVPLPAQLPVGDGESFSPGDEIIGLIQQLPSEVTSEATSAHEVTSEATSAHEVTSEATSARTVTAAGQATADATGKGAGASGDGAASGVGAPDGTADADVDERGNDSRGFPVWLRVPEWLEAFGGPRGEPQKVTAAMLTAEAGKAIKGAGAPARPVSRPKKPKPTVMYVPIEGGDDEHESKRAARDVAAVECLEGPRRRQSVKKFSDDWVVDNKKHKQSQQDTQPA